MHKRIGKEIRENRRSEESTEKANKFERFVTTTFQRILPTKKQESHSVAIVGGKDSEITAERKKGRLIYKSENVLPSTLQNSPTVYPLFTKKIQAVAEVLAAFGVFDEMSYKDQEKLLKAISEIIAFED
jgi:hypothetical protein